MYRNVKNALGISICNIEIRLPLKRMTSVTNPRAEQVPINTPFLRTLKKTMDNKESKTKKTMVEAAGVGSNVCSRQNSPLPEANGWF